MMMGSDIAQRVSLGRSSLLLTAPQQRPVLVRYGAPFDAELLVAMYRRLSEQSIRLRFGAPRTHLTDAMLRAEMAQVASTSPAGQASLIASVGEDGARSAVALVQLVPLPSDPSTAEVAIVVRDDYQRQGLGRALCRMLGEIARGRGVRQLQIDTLAENKAVLRLIRGMGTRYTIETRRGETRVLIALE